MDVESLLRQLQSRITALSRATQVALLAGLGTVLLLTWLLNGDSQARTDAYLFTGLDPADAGEIIAKLKEQRIPYNLANNGAAIMVSESKVHELRLELAQAGLPKGGGVGFEIFDRPSYGQSDFVQQKNFVRALQGELERTIGSMSSVGKARVHLVLAERRMFATPQDAASASVVIKMRPGRALGEAQAAAIVHLVASSVPALSPQRVTLVDDLGNVLSAHASGDGMSGEELDYRRKMEKDVEHKLSSILDRFVGRDKSSVQVSADLVFNHVEKTEELFDPDAAVLRSEQATDEAQSGSSAARGGVAGVRSNLATPDGGSAPTADAATPSQQSQKHTTTKNFEINKVTSHTVFGRSQLQRLTAAVLVDGTYLGENKTFQPLPEEQLEALQLVLKQAMGFDEKRGDQIAVRCVPFHNEPPLVEEPTKLQVAAEQARRWAVPSAALVAALLALVTTVTLLRRRRSLLPAPLLLPGGPRTVRDVQAMVSGNSSESDLRGIPAPPIAIDDGSKAAHVLRGWLSSSKPEEEAGKR